MSRISLFTLAALALSSCAYRPPKNADKTLQVIGSRRESIVLPANSFPRYQGTKFLRFEQLVELSKDPNPSPSTRAQVDEFLRRAIISNEAYYRGIRPKRLITEGSGPALRVATWNIEKSFTIREVADALASESAYIKLLNLKRFPQGSPAYDDALRQRERLATADVIFLQEMDLGVSRSDYIDATRHLARKLGMNYAYAPQSLEIDPALLGLDSESGKSARKVAFLPSPPQITYPKPDPHRYKGVFGSAILTKYPIISADVEPLKNQPYDWYHRENESSNLVEHGRRISSAFFFENIITRELKVGGRHFFRVDIAVPDAPHQRISLINNHLEIKTVPKERQKQMVEILGKIQQIPHPVIMAGDHNSAPNDVSPTSFHRVMLKTVDNPTSFLGTLSNVSGFVSGTVIPLYRERGILNSIKNLHHPLAWNVPLLFPNPVRGMFNQVEKFRFHDETTFDFRGKPEKSINSRRGELANSSEKKRYGHVPTFRLQRPFGPIGRFKLDWIFVKSGELKHPKGSHQSYRFAPHYGETLQLFNDGVIQPFSDHYPMVVDLPFEEPVKSKKP